MPCDYSPYTLPTIDFVAGETQDFAFYTYFYKSHQPFALSGCTANFSIVSFTNKTGVPILTKPMESHFNDDVTAENVLAVTLDPLDTVDLCVSTSIKSLSKILTAISRFPNKASYLLPIISTRVSSGNKPGRMHPAFIMPIFRGGQIL